MTSQKWPPPSQFLSVCLFVFFRYSTIFSSFCVVIRLHLLPRPLRLRGRQFWVGYWGEKRLLRSESWAVWKQFLTITVLHKRPLVHHEARTKGASLSLQTERVNNQSPNQSIDPSLNQTTSRFVGRSLQSVTNLVTRVSHFFRPRNEIQLVMSLLWRLYSFGFTPESVHNGAYAGETQ